jgi:hypothetical protein
MFYCFHLFSLVTEISSMAKRAIERGPRYRDVRSSVLSGAGAEWIVEEVFHGVDGVHYACLACAGAKDARGRGP